MSIGNIIDGVIEKLRASTSGIELQGVSLYSYSGYAVFDFHVPNEPAERRRHFSRSLSDNEAVAFSAEDVSRLLVDEAIHRMLQIVPPPSTTRGDG